jgi:hypothetical protein
MYQSGGRRLIGSSRRLVWEAPTQTRAQGPKRRAGLTVGGEVILDAGPCLDPGVDLLSRKPDKQQRSLLRL